MLLRTSDRWHALTQAYGSADDIPRLLDALDAATSAQDVGELWFGIWATLCPDQRVYDAAYAAVPHLLAWSHGRTMREQALTLHFAAAVESLRATADAPAIPTDLVEWYARAVETLPALVLARATEPWDADVAQIMAAALVAGKRQAALARGILALSDDPEVG
jgi:hypothetical protein